MADEKLVVVAVLAVAEMVAPITIMVMAMEALASMKISW